MSDYEWSYPVEVETLKQGQVKHFELNCEDADIRAEVAERLGVTDILSFSAAYDIEAKSDGCRFLVTGGVRARLVQECVNTLDPIETLIEEGGVESWFVRDDAVISFTARKSRQAQKEGESMDAAPGEVKMLEEEDAPEMIKDGVIDLGELSVQFLALSINPFPRKDDDSQPFEYREFSKDSPFASLAELKNK